MSTHTESTDLHVGYVLARYPVLSETFIIREILELQNRGVRLTIYAFGMDHLSTPHEIIDRINAPVIYLPTRKRYGSVFRAFLHWLRYDLSGVFSVLRGAGSAESFRTCLGSFYLAREASKDPPRHIHVHFISSPSAAAWTMSRLLGVDFSITAHAHDVFLTSMKELKTRIHQASWIRTISRFNRRILRTIAPEEERKIEVIRAGIDLDRFPYVPKKREATGSVHLLSVGRLVEIKGMDTLIDAVAELSDLPWRLSIVGDGPLKSALTSYAENRGVSSRITWLGPQSEHAVSALLSDTDIFILASQRDKRGNMDGIPVVLMEALSRGVPAISSRVSGIPELLGGGAGIIVPPRNSDAIADAVRYLWRNARKAERIRRTGRRRIERGYDIRRTAGFMHARFIKLAERTARSAH